MATARLRKKRVQADYVRSGTNAENRVRTRSQSNLILIEYNNRAKNDNNANHQHKKLRPSPTPVDPIAVATTHTKPHIPELPVANPNTQQQLPAEQVSVAGSQQKIGHHLQPTFSPARDNFFLKVERDTKFGKCFNSYSCMLLYIYIP